jgi:hypothetical protein
MPEVSTARSSATGRERFEGTSERTRSSPALRGRVPAKQVTVFRPCEDASFRTAFVQFPDAHVS